MIVSRFTKGIAALVLTDRQCHLVRNLSGVLKSIKHEKIERQISVLYRLWCLCS